MDLIYVTRDPITTVVSPEQGSVFLSCSRDSLPVNSGVSPPRSDPKSLWFSAHFHSKNITNQEKTGLIQDYTRTKQGRNHV